MERLVPRRCRGCGRPGASERALASGARLPHAGTVAQRGCREERRPVAPRVCGAAGAYSEPVALDRLVCGLIGAFSRPGLRWIGWTYVALIAMMIGLHAKDYYPAAFYPVLFATGAFTFERWTQRARWTRPGLAAGAVLAGAALIPFAVPVLPIDAFIAYQRALHLTPKSGEHMELGVLPQDYADMIGWPEMTDAIAQVYEALPPADRARAMIYTANYGEAAALDFFGAERGLPPASSHHNQYYLWGPRGYAGEDAVVISINVNRKDMSKSFRDVRVAREYPGNPLAIPLERDDPILVSRGLMRPMAQAWPFTPKLYY